MSSPPVVTLGQLIQEHLKGYDWCDRVPRAACDLKLTDADRQAAWALYVELASRIATQPLADEEGVEQAALKSIADLFEIGRAALRAAGREAAACSALVLTLLNGRVRPFTAEWHKHQTEGRFKDPAMSGRFRVELRELQIDLRAAADALAALAGVPRLTEYGTP
ncbi:MAG TPA: hypothetical protein VHP37_08100 [Burkholderiales bacterium]|nr:hypothetical protein [Burkholderiales bacterium]